VIVLLGHAVLLRNCRRFTAGVNGAGFGSWSWWLGRRGEFTAYDFRGETGEAQVVIARRAVAREQLRGRAGLGRLVRAFEDRGALVDFVEHGDVKHLRAGPGGRADQAPVESAALTRNLVEWARASGFPAGEVIPAKSRIDIS
jgi:hypothetical protein